MRCSATCPRLTSEDIAAGGRGLGRGRPPALAGARLPRCRGQCRLHRGRPRRAERSLTGSVDSGAIDFDTAVRLTRAVGQTCARLADWQVATLTSRVEQLEAGDEATGSRIGSALRLAEEVGVPFERLLVYAWRRHLAAAVARVEALGANDEDLHTVEVTVGFADLVQFTALSNDDGRGPDRRHGRDLRDPLRRRGRRQARPSDQDARATPCCSSPRTPSRGMDIALSIIDVIGNDARLPDVQHRHRDRRRS